MNPRCLALFFLALAPLYADAPQLSSQRLDILDQRGYFTPAFKKAAHDLVQARQALAQAQIDQKRLGESLPGLRRQSSEAVDRAAALRQELALYTHPQNTDFDALQAAMKNPAATPQQRLTLAQAFVWSYPTDPHQAEASADLQQIQKQSAARLQSEKQETAAQIAARIKLVQRAKARDLSLSEWQDLLRDMSQQELLAFLGHPQSEAPDYWIYSGAWTWDPATKERCGLRIDFNGTRVLNVVSSLR